MPQTVPSQQPDASTMEENVVSPSYQFRSEIVAVLKELIVEEMASLFTILDQHPNVTWAIALVKDFHAQMVSICSMKKIDYEYKLRRLTIRNILGESLYLEE